MCTASLESMAIEVKDPTFPVVSTEVVVQEDADEHDDAQVAYLR